MISDGPLSTINNCELRKLESAICDLTKKLWVIIAIESRHWIEVELLRSPVEERLIE